MRHNSDLRELIDDEDIVVAVLAVPSPRPRNSPTISSTRA